MQGIGDVYSVHSTDKVYIRFLNLTRDTIEMIWVDFTGKYVRYQLLRRGAYIDIDTYVTHPWVAVNADTKDRKLIDHKYVYLPRAYSTVAAESDPNMREPVVRPERRQIVCVTSPMHTLRRSALLKIRNCFKRVEDVDSLDLPKGLSDELKAMINLRNRRIASPLTMIV